MFQSAELDYVSMIANEIAYTETLEQETHTFGKHVSIENMVKSCTHTRNALCISEYVYTCILYVHVHNTYTYTHITRNAYVFINNIFMHFCTIFFFLHSFFILFLNRETQKTHRISWKLEKFPEFYEMPEISSEPKFGIFGFPDFRSFKH